MELGQCIANSLHLGKTRTQRVQYRIFVFSCKPHVLQKIHEFCTAGF